MCGVRRAVCAWPLRCAGLWQAVPVGPVASAEAGGVAARRDRGAGSTAAVISTDLSQRGFHLVGRIAVTVRLGTLALAGALAGVMQLLCCLSPARSPGMSGFQRPRFLTVGVALVISALVGPSPASAQSSTDPVYDNRVGPHGSCFVESGGAP